MEKSNIIISIIIVLCIAAAVAAYGITNSDNPVFSNLTSMGSNNAGHGPGNHTATNSSSHATTHGSSDSGSSDSGSSGSGSDTSGSASRDASSSGSNSGSGNGNGNGGSDSNSGSDSSSVSATTVQNDAWQYISEDGCYPGQPYQSGDYWIVPIYDANDNVVDSIGYTLSGEYMGRM